MRRYDVKSISLEQLNTRISHTRTYINAMVAMRKHIKKTTSKARYKLWSESYTHEIKRARYELKQCLKATEEK